MLQDVRVAVRGLLRQPGLALTAVLTLAIAMGANTTMFSVAHAVLWEPLPATDLDRIVVVWDDTRTWGLTEPEFTEFKEQSATLEDLAAYVVVEMNAAADDGSERVPVAISSASLFGVLRASVRIGRVFAEEEASPGSPDVAVLSETIWRRSFGADAEVLGKTLRLNEQTYTVIGVMSDESRFPLPTGADVFVPLQLDRVSPNAQGRYLRTLGRMTPGGTTSGLSRELNRLNDRFVDDGPQRFPGGFNRTGAIHVVPYREDLVSHARTQLLMLFAAVGLLLVISCSNVGSLLLIRAEARFKEITIQRALGASRGRIASSVLAEGLVLCALGGGVGVIVAAYAVPLLAQIVPATVPFVSRSSVNLPVLIFSFGSVLLATLLVGLTPALKTSSPTLTNALNAGGRSDRLTSGGRRRRGAYVALQLGLAVVVVVGASLLATSVRQVQQLDPGFEPSGVMTARLSLPERSYPEATDVIALLERLESDIHGTAGVESIGASTNLPLLGNINNATFQIDGRAPATDGSILADFEIVTTGYFETMGIRSIGGRRFDGTDRDGALPAVILNEAAVRRYWPGERVVGRRLRLNDALPWMTVVGVVSDVPAEKMSTPVQPKMYLPLTQTSYAGWLGVGRSFNVVVKSSADAATILPELRTVVSRLDPGLPVSGAHELEQVVADSIAVESFVSLMMISFAGIALLLAVVGIYGAVGNSVSQRHHEFGVRLALGALPRTLTQMVLNETARPVAAGLTLGILCTLLLTRLISSTLYQADAHHTFTIVLVTLAMGGVGIVASFLPARRAGRVDLRELLDSE